MSTFQPMPGPHADLVALICHWLRPQIAPTPTGRIVPKDRPHVQVMRSGGTISGHVDQAEVQFDVRADDWDTAFAVAAQVRGILPGARGGVEGVTQAVERSGLFEFQDGEGVRLAFTWLIAIKQQ